MLFDSIKMLLLISLVHFIDSKNLRRDIRLALLPPCKENAQLPFRYQGEIIKIDDYKFTFNGSVLSDRQMRAPVEVIHIK